MKGQLPAFHQFAHFVEHRLREWFRYREQPVFDPHFDAHALFDLCVIVKLAKGNV